ncbi:DUF420 domain-containing protein [Gorillibacterium massiliense]|uniref:DUF420 domain-containing protein n=1 Tax=Gorillibacterium massiliense TaxID=1280390 RepID=UPI0004B06B27|nr:DUF420 domain-containing protein [Gorillibacterium massiliense]
MVHVLPTISTTFIVISATLVGFGWYYIRKGKQETHQKFMVTGAVFALMFFLIYMSRTLFEGNTSFSDAAPTWIKDSYFVFLIFHITLATIAGVFGLITLFLAYRKEFGKHRKLGRWTATLWLLTAPTGVMVYLLLYVMYPGGTTKPMLDVLLGG